MIFVVRTILVYGLRSVIGTISVVGVLSVVRVISALRVIWDVRVLLFINIKAIIDEISVVGEKSVTGLVLLLVFRPIALHQLLGRIWFPGVTSSAGVFMGIEMFCITGILTDVMTVSASGEMSFVRLKSFVGVILIFLVICAI